MRWKWPDPRDAKAHGPLQGATKQREKIIAKMDAFWTAFTKKTADLDALFSREKQWDLPAWMNARLTPIAEGIMWEYGPATRGNGHRLVLTPEQDFSMWPLVEAMLARAPKVKGWEFHLGRLPERGELFVATIEGRTQRKMPKVRVGVRRGDHHMIDLEVELEGVPRKETDGVAYLIAETLLGEDVLHRWVGTIEAVAKSKKRLLSIDAAREAVAAEIAKIRAELPKKPCIDRVAKAEWSLFEMKPKPQDEYGAQDDLFVSPTMHPDVWMATRAPGFANERFSRHGEVFAYVKMDGRDGLEGSAFGDRDDIEEAITRAITPRRLGAVVGGGTGLRYSYVELALLDVARALPKIRDVLAKGKIPLRSWILFHAPTLEHEWVPIHERTPPPP